MVVNENGKACNETFDRTFSYYHCDREGLRKSNAKIVLKGTNTIQRTIYLQSLAITKIADHTYG